MKRVLLKLSGEALAGGNPNHMGFDMEVCKNVAEQVKPAVENGLQLGVVIGGGNFWRGRTGNEIERTKSDQIGMLATVKNALYVSEIFRTAGLKTEVFTPFAVGTMTKLFSKDLAVEAMEAGKVVFFAGGTGHPYFSTDTGVMLRAIEMEADMILLAKAIDAVYDSDPATNPNAVKYDRVSIEEVVAKKLKVVDLTASIMALEQRMPMAVFALDQENSIARALSGEITGTVVTVD